MSPVSVPLFLKVLRILEDFARSWSLRRGRVQEVSDMVVFFYIVIYQHAMIIFNM